MVGVMLDHRDAHRLRLGNFSHFAYADRSNYLTVFNVTQPATILAVDPV